MSWTDGLAAGLAAGGLSYLGAQSTNQANADIAAANNAWSAEQYAKRYQTQVKDLVAAGLNPMLAYNQSPGSSPTAQQVVFQNPLAAATSAYSSARDTGSRATEAAASSTHHYSSANKADAEVKQVEANVEKIKEETKNIPDQGKQIRQTIQMLADQGALYAEKGLTEHSIRAQLAATIRKLHSEADLLGFDISAAEKFDNFGRESGQYKAIIDLVKTIFGPRGGGITINKGK